MSWPANMASQPKKAGASSGAIDRAADATWFQAIATAPADVVLIFEGVFLLRPELIDQWDLSIFVWAAFEELVNRARTRDLAAYGTVTEVERRFRERYIPAQQLYFDAAHPTEHADIIVHNDAPQQPSWITRAS